MLSRPFRTDCFSTPLSGGGNLQIIVEFKPGSDLASKIPAQLRRPFQGLADMAQWGGMAGKTFQPQQSTMDLVIDGQQVGPTTIRWDFNATRVDPGAAFVIQNIVHYLHRVVSPVQTLVLRSPLVRDGASVQEGLPGDYQPYPFTVHDEREDSTVMIDVDFLDRQAPLRPNRFARPGMAGTKSRPMAGFAARTIPQKTCRLTSRMISE